MTFCYPAVRLDEGEALHLDRAVIAIDKETTMQFRIGLAIVAATVLFAGCATPPQPPVPLASTAMSTTTDRIGVAMAPLPKVDTYLPGADCLLCLAAASLANHSLTAHTQKLPVDDVRKLKEDMAEAIRKRGAQVQVIPDDVDVASLPDASPKAPNGARKDFASLGSKYGITKLVVLQINMLGMLRTYAAYFPTSDPKGVLRGTGYMVNLGTNTYEWYLPVDVVRSSDGPWDEPPAFPGLTNAYFQAIEQGKDQFVKPFRD
nr:hypothetical protein [uncultured Caldimonas sp.]